MSKLIKPSSLVVDPGATRALQVRGLFVADGPTVWRNRVGNGYLNSVVPANQKYTAGPAGMGGRFTATNVYECFWTSVGGAQVPGSYGQRATFFAVVSFESIGTNQAFGSIGAADARWDINLLIDSTDGFKTSYTDGGYTQGGYQSIGAAPAIGVPHAIVVRASGSSRANVRSIHTSDGRSVVGTATRASYEEVGWSTIAVNAGGSGEHAGFNGHVYQIGYADKLWSEEEIGDYLEDPWRFLRRRSLVSMYGAAFASAPAGDPEVAVSGNGVNIADGDSTADLADHTDFGSVAQGGSAVSRTFTVSNTGTADLTTSSLTVPTGFSVTEGLSATIAASASDTFTVEMATATAGLKSGNVSFTTNDSDEGTFDFAIAGVVTAPSNDPPTGSITSPVTGATITSIPTMVTASLTDSDGTVIQARLFEDGAPIGTDIASPWEWLWSPSNGVKTLWVEVTDDDLDFALTAEVVVTVAVPPPPPPPPPPPSGGPGGGALFGALNGLHRNPRTRLLRKGI